MSKTYGVGVIGCGNISAAYMRLAPLFRSIEMRACADLDPDAAKARASEYGLRAQTVDELLANDEVDIVVNLTVPAAHFAVSMDVLSAGKHVYSEKPFVLSLEEGQALAKAAKACGLRVGSAPDTFFGSAHQYARRLVDNGDVGTITSGTCHVMSHGMESWHPNPDFFFKAGGGPVLDLGPYYIADLVQLIGPVKRVAALSSIPTKERTITSKPRYGEKIAVETPTTVHALLEFESGAIITLGTSWDVWKHGHANIELYGSGGSLFVPDPNFFAGTVRHSVEGGELIDGPDWNHPFGIVNQDSPRGPLANYRSVGLADMAAAIDDGKPHRCSLEFALHGIEVMTAILESGRDGRFITLSTTCERPEAVDPDAARALLAA